MHESANSGTGQEISKKLQRLLAALEAIRGQGGEPRRAHYNSILASVHSTLRDVPLVHAVGSIPELGHVLDDGCLRARRDRTAGGVLEPERRLQIPASVYTAAGIAYPNRDVALVFNALVETSTKVSASPWDSGHFFGAQQGALRGTSEEQRRDLFWSQELPSPEYRKYLVHYVATCFRSARDYICNRPHCYSDPLGMLHEHRWQSRIFEVRFLERLPVDTPGLLAVFYPRDSEDAFTREFRQHLRRLSEARVDIQPYDGSRGMPVGPVSAWMCKHLGIPNGAAA